MLNFFSNYTNILFIITFGVILFHWINLLANGTFTNRNYAAFSLGMPDNLPEIFLQGALCAMLLDITIQRYFAARTEKNKAVQAINYHIANSALMCLTIILLHAHPMFEDYIGYILAVPVVIIFVVGIVLLLRPNKNRYCQNSFFTDLLGCLLV